MRPILLFGFLPLNYQLADDIICQLGAKSFLSGVSAHHSFAWWGQLGLLVLCWVGVQIWAVLRGSDS